MPVTRNVLRSFARATRATPLADPAASENVTAKLQDFKAGERWARKFVKRNKIQSVRLHGEAGSVDKEGIKEAMDELRALCAKYPARLIFNVDETGLQWELKPRRTYLSTSEERKTAPGSKGMFFKDRLSAIMCCNADGTAKVDLAIIGKAKEPRCFFSHDNAWSDTATFRKWWCQVFLPFVRRFTHEPVLLLMDGCSSHGYLVDDRGQVTIKFNPPLCTSVHQPMDMGVIAKMRVNYRKELLDVRASTMLVADTLRAQAKARKIKARTMGLAQGHQPHVQDAAELIQKAWASVTAQDIARCSGKAETLPKEMASDLTKQHGKARCQIAEPDLKDLTETVNMLSMSEHEAQRQGSRIEDEEIAELFAELHIEPGRSVSEDAVDAIHGWATIEDDDEVVEALKQDTVDDMTAQLAGTQISTGREEEEEQEREDSGDENTGRARRAPPAYRELSSPFGFP